MSLYLILLLLVIIMSEELRIENFDNQQATIYWLPPHPQNHVLFFESTLCLPPNIPIKALPHNNIRCPKKPIVTVQPLGWISSQIWEYISIWATAKVTGRELYFASCLITELEKIFIHLPVPPLSYPAYCPLLEHPVAVTEDKLHHSNGNIILPNYIQLPTYIASLLSEIRQFFPF